MRGIKAYGGVFRHCYDILNHIRTYSELCVTLTYTTVPYYNPSIFRTIVIFKKACQTCKMIRHTQSQGKVRIVYPSIFRDIWGYSGTLIHYQLHLSIILFAKRSILNVSQCFEYASASVMLSILYSDLMLCIQSIRSLHKILKVLSVFV